MSLSKQWNNCSPDFSVKDIHDKQFNQWDYIHPEMKANMKLVMKGTYTYQTQPFMPMTDGNFLTVAAYSVPDGHCRGFQG